MSDEQSVLLGSDGHRYLTSSSRPGIRDAELSINPSNLRWLWHKDVENPETVAILEHYRPGQIERVFERDSENAGERRASGGGGH
ncbi:unnamed protein product [Cercospora beticola]|nr:unnamed protein product [Cercospora beticola]